jgi:superfamily II DNA or RNA helicase
MSLWHLKGSPYTVQKKALDKAKGQRGFGFFMEMGLGKTVTAYNEFIDLYTMDLFSFR